MLSNHLELRPAERGPGIENRSSQNHQTQDDDYESNPSRHEPSHGPDPFFVAQFFVEPDRSPDPPLGEFPPGFKVLVKENVIDDGGG